MLGSEAEILTIEILEKIPKNFFVFRPFRASSYKPPSARESKISPSLPLGSVGVTTPLSIGVGWRLRETTSTDLAKNFAQNPSISLFLEPPATISAKSKTPKTASLSGGTLVKSRYLKIGNYGRR